MTWLPIETGDTPERDALLGLQPDTYAELRAILEISFQMTDAALLELCRVRLAQLMRSRAELAGVDEGRLSELARWDRSAGFDERERAVLLFTEQYQLDHHGIREEQKDELAALLTQRGFVNFVWALHMNDAYIRTLSFLDVAPDPVARERPERGAGARRSGPVAPEGRGDAGEDLRDPRFAEAYGRLNKATVRHSLVDDTTSEAIRLHNAQFQGCRY